MAQRKMKKFITILVLTTISAVLSIHAKADKNKNEWLPDYDRSISIYLDIEENDLHIYSDKEYDCVNIQVVDVNGIMIHSDIINIPANDALIIPLSDLPKGNYQVTLSKNNQPVVWYLTK